MDRRRFMKYAGATAAVVGASALGLDYVLRSSPPTVSPATLTPALRELTTTASSSSSAQSVQLASLQGRLFFDCNGNGIQEGDGPAILGAKIELKDSIGAVAAESVTDSAGDYKLEDVRTGPYRLHVEADKKFRYMCRSGEEFTSVSERYDIPVNGIQRLDIGLMEGFLTKPFLTKKYSIGRFYDWPPARRPISGGTEEQDQKGSMEAVKITRVSITIWQRVRM